MIGAPDTRTTSCAPPGSQLFNNRTFAFVVDPSSYSVVQDLTLPGPHNVEITDSCARLCLWREQTVKLRLKNGSEAGEIGPQ